MRRIYYFVYGICYASWLKYPISLHYKSSVPQLSCCTTTALYCDYTVQFSSVPSLHAPAQLAWWTVHRLSCIPTALQVQFNCIPPVLRSKQAVPQPHQRPQAPQVTLPHSTLLTVISFARGASKKATCSACAKRPGRGFLVASTTWIQSP